MLQACYKAATELYDELSAGNPTFKKFYESTRKFQADSNLWLQASEYAYDSAMLRLTRG